MRPFTMSRATTSRYTVLRFSGPTRCVTVSSGIVTSLAETRASRAPSGSAALLSKRAARSACGRFRSAKAAVGKLYDTPPRSIVTSCSVTVLTAARAAPHDPGWIAPIRIEPALPSGTFRFVQVGVPTPLAPTANAAASRAIRIRLRAGWVVGIGGPLGFTRLRHNGRLRRSKGGGRVNMRAGAGGAGFIPPVVMGFGPPPRGGPDERGGFLWAAPPLRGGGAGGG